MNTNTNNADEQSHRRLAMQVVNKRLNELCSGSADICDCKIDKERIFHQNGKSLSERPLRLFAVKFDVHHGAPR